ncbi:DUF2975 domain-containing protein [Arthrobacter sp. ISL-69]|nr:DUF2975 domain-containing protein [Arthrobacter sp. ISL-69]
MALPCSAAPRLRLPLPLCRPFPLVCVWRLLTMVRRGTVFSHAAFRYVDVVTGAVAAASQWPATPKPNTCRTNWTR